MYSDYVKPIQQFNGYYADQSGSIYKYDGKRLKAKKLWLRRDKNLVLVKLNNKVMNAARIIYQAFNGPLPDDMYIDYHDGNKHNIKLSNLKVISKRVYGKKTGYKANSRAIAHLDEFGNVIQTFRSSRAAAKNLYISYQTVLDYCKHKVRNPMYNLRFENEL